MTNPKRGGGEGVSTSNESYKLATGGGEASKDSCVTQACTGTAISLGFISCKEMGRERKPRLCGREEVLHLLLGGVEFQPFSQPSFPFSSPPPTQATLLMLDLQHYSRFRKHVHVCSGESQQCLMEKQGRTPFLPVFRHHSLD